MKVLQTMEDKIVRWMGSEGRFNAHGFWNLRERAERGGLVGVINKILYYRTTNKYHSQIKLETVIKGEPILPHGINGVFISANAIIGENCTIFHHVTIRSNDIETSKAFGAPVIGNNVYIGTGASIIGGVMIGDNVHIGANCIVVEDVPDNSTVVMHKPRVLPFKGEQRSDV